MRFTLRYVLCMVTSVSLDQQYIFGVQSLLVTERAFLTRNDLAVMLRRPLPRLPQLMLSCGPMGQCLNELGQYIEKRYTNVCLAFKEVTLIC